MVETICREIRRNFREGVDLLIVDGYQVGFWTPKEMAKNIKLDQVIKFDFNCTYPYPTITKIYPTFIEIELPKELFEI